MKTKLNYSKVQFLKDIELYIDRGNKLLIDSQIPNLKEDEFLKIETEYKYWYEEILEFLKQVFNNSDNEYKKDFSNSSSNTIDSLSDVMRGANPDDIRFRFKYFKSNLEPKIQSLISLTRKLNFIPEQETEDNTPPNSKNMNQNKVFISHSSLDSKYVEKIIDTLEIIGIPSTQIFCSSFEGYGIKLGKDFLEALKRELNGKVFVLFILSSNFYSSVVSLCEMGATWIKTNSHIPILIPPFDYKDVKGVIPTTHGMKINEKEKYNTLKEVMEEYFSLKPIQLNVWERKRDNILKEIKHLLDKQGNQQVEEKSFESEKNMISQKDLYYENLEEKLKQLSQEEWPNDYEMQLDTEQRQIESLRRLNQM